MLPYRHLTDILEMLAAMDKLAPGVNGRDTLLYGVEVKFYSARPELDDGLQTPVKNLYAVGDGAGITRGLVQASAAGVIAARSILGIRTTARPKTPPPSGRRREGDRRRRHHGGGRTGADRRPARASSRRRRPPEAHRPPAPPGPARRGAARARASALRASTRGARGRVTGEAVETDGEARVQADDTAALDELVGEVDHLGLVGLVARPLAEMDVPADDRRDARVAEALEQVRARLRVPGLLPGDVVEQRPAVTSGAMRYWRRSFSAAVSAVATAVTTRECAMRALGDALLRQQLADSAATSGRPSARGQLADAGEVLRRVGVEQHAGIVDLDHGGCGDVPEQQLAEASGRIGGAGSRPAAPPSSSGGCPSTPARSG